MKPTPCISFMPQGPGGLFTLQGQDVTYAVSVDPDTLELLHTHWGQPAQPPLGALRPPQSGWQIPLDTSAREFPDTGRGDTRRPAIQIETPQGHRISALVYAGHDTVAGKPGLAGLPATYASAAGAPCDSGNDANVHTLRIRLRDAHLQLDATLNYTLFPQHNAVARSVCLHNGGLEALTVRQLQSFSVDLPEGDWETLQLSGTWAAERTPVRRPVGPGETGIQSRLGYSSHQHSPFFALLERNTCETFGQVYGLMFVYSGSFAAHAEQNPQGLVRLQMGLNPEAFSWRLAPGESFQSPECVGIYSSHGLGSLTRNAHDLLRAHLLRGTWRDRLRPVLANNWEATYFDFTAADIVRLAQHAKSLGIDLMVLDDGWFGDKYKRNGDREGLGDFDKVNHDKLPQGLEGLSQTLHDPQGLSMRFGLWVEPEMANPKSEVYEAHPEWFLSVPGRKPSEVRNQLVLDLSNPAVQAHVIAMCRQVFKQGKVDYVKWDLNRGMHEIASAYLPAHQQGEVTHRYMLGLYRVLDTLTLEFPEVLFESCASGGGRFDAGMLYYMPQTWTSDNTEGLSRRKIQRGTRLIFPASTMGGHVAAGDHQVQRHTSFKFRAHGAMAAGSFGFEMDLSRLSAAERQEAQCFTALYRRIQPVVHHGDAYCLRDPLAQDFNAHNWPAHMFVHKNRSEAVVFADQIRAQVERSAPRLRLAGLQPEALYLRLDRPDPPLSGATLMHYGMELSLHGDCDSQLIHLHRVSAS